MPRPIDVSAPLDRLYAYLGVDEDGREGVVLIPGTHEPMVRRRLADALDLYDVAQAVADADGREIRLWGFGRVRVARVVVPRTGGA